MKATHDPVRHRGAGPSAIQRLFNERGSALFLLLILAVVMATIMAGIFSYISQTSRMEARSNVGLESTYAAEFAFERAYQQLKGLVSQDSVNLPTIEQTTEVTNLTKAPTDVFGADQGYTWQSFITIPVQYGKPVDKHADVDPTQGAYKFLSIVEFTRRVPTMSSPVHVQFQHEWSYVFTPLFQYAIFYDGDLELFPGANFVVGGRVHSNGKIYTGTSKTLTFKDLVSDVNGLSNSYSPNDPRSPGSPGSKDNVVYEKKAPIKTTREDPPGTSTADKLDANYNNDGGHELIEVANAWQTDPNAADRLYTKAGIKVLVSTDGTKDTNADNGVKIPAGKRVFFTKDGTTIPASDPLATYLDGKLFKATTGNVRDYRENADITTTDIDVSTITSAYNESGLPKTIPAADKWPSGTPLAGQAIPLSLRGKDLWNGVLYVTDVTNIPTRRTGIRIINGDKLPDGGVKSNPVAGLTIASANAAYIAGNYNAGGDAPVNTSSKLDADNYVKPYTVQPAAIIADAVTVLSSNWSNSYDNKTALSSRKADDTTINCALISGIVASTKTPSPGAYSGGVENYIRLLEDWSGKRLTYYGSMINVYESQQSTGKWRDTGNYYNAPTRNWYYDTNFRDPRKLPPGTPVTRSLRRGQWVQVLNAAN